MSNMVKHFQTVITWLLLIFISRVYILAQPADIDTSTAYMSKDYVNDIKYEIKEFNNLCDSCQNHEIDFDKAIIHKIIEIEYIKFTYKFENQVRYLTKIDSMTVRVYYGEDGSKYSRNLVFLHEYEKFMPGLISNCTRYFQNHNTRDTLGLYYEGFNNLNLKRNHLCTFIGDNYATHTANGFYIYDNYETRQSYNVTYNKEFTNDEKNILWGNYLFIPSRLPFNHYYRILYQFYPFPEQFGGFIAKFDYVTENTEFVYSTYLGRADKSIKVIPIKEGENLGKFYKR